MKQISHHIAKGIRRTFPTDRCGTIHICSTNKHVMDALKEGHLYKKTYWDNNLFMYYLRINRNIEAHLQRQTP